MIIQKDKIKIAVIGLGYVGLPLAIQFSKFFDVIGYDIDSERVSDLKKNFDKTLEIKSKELKKNKVFYTSKSSDLSEANIFVVTIPTPVYKNNVPDLSMLKKSTKIISKYLKKNSIVIYESTVFPGCTEEICLPILNQNKKVKFNKDFFIGYSPERINPGDKNIKLTNIIKVISGSSKESLEVIKYIYSKIIKAGLHISKSIKIAEAAKVIENTQRDLNIALVNELFIIFNKLKIKTSDVLNAANTKWNFLNFKPGLVGGHCIGVDPYYLTYKCEQIGYKPNIILSGRKINDNFHTVIGKRALKIIKIKKLKKNILILGYSFKENVPDYRNSRVFNLVKFFAKKNCKISIHDPFLDENKKNFPFLNLSIKDIKHSKKKFDLVILSVPHSQYLKNQNLLKGLLNKRGIIYDFRSLLKPDENIIQD